MTDVAEMSEVQRSTIHMCEYGLKDPVSKLHMKKPMSFLHNIPMGIFANMIKRCRGTHEHLKSLVRHEVMEAEQYNLKFILSSFANEWQGR